MRNITDLREALFDTITAIREKKITAQEADAICLVAKRLIETAEAELRFIEADKAAAFVPQPEGPKKLTVRRVEGLVK